MEKETTTLMLKRKIHLIGIGGIGMSAVARILNYEGHRVTGSDSKENSIIKEMIKEGIRCFKGHSEKNLGDCDIVVYSSSIDGNNVELRLARKRDLQVLHRSEMLSELLREKKTIAVTGAHGKTTTSALLAHIFNKAGMHPTAAIGGEVLNFGSNVLIGKGDYFIIEADESDGSFLKFYPDRAVLLNIDREHLDYFKNISNAIAIYKRFINNVKRNGTIYYNMDDRYLNRIFSSYRGRSVSFGMKGEPDVKAVDIRQSGLRMYFKCLIRGKEIPETFSFSIPGRHNVTNVLATIAVATDADIDFKDIREALATYKGTRRRFEIKDVAGDIMLVEDYAHHPTEIEAVLRACAPLNRNIIAVFQPHRYTRTKDLFKEFLNCFKAADHIILTDIYAASEKAIKGVTSKKLFVEMKRTGIRKVEYVKKDAITNHVKNIAKEGDIILILGAGDIGKVAAELEAALNKKGTLYTSKVSPVEVV